MSAEAPEILPSAQRLYARVWRWHFFAALIVIPFVLWQSVTGVLYLWNRELGLLTHPHLLRVEPATQSVPYEQQLASVLRHHERERLQAIEATDDPSRSTTFFFRDDNGLAYPAFVDPHTGAYLGHVSSLQWLRGLSRGLHGGWPIQPWGSYLLELGASWAILMTLTGLYLWWPRNAHGLAGVLYPRLRSGPRIFWRDLHATVGVYFALVVLGFLFTALPWTTFWGSNVLAPVQRTLGQESPTGFFFATGGDHHHASSGEMQDSPDHAHAHHAPQALDLDAVIARARTAGLRGTIELHPQPDAAPINLRDQHARSSDVVWLQLDAISGAVLTRVTWTDQPPIPKFVALGVDLHEGRFFGRINQIFNTLVATGLVWLSVTGFIGWYRRRPHGGLAAPPRRSLRIPRAVIATGIALCVVLPLLAISVLALFLMDRGFGRLLPART
jgi:uncharacterized iron-regulated membrane protein